MVALMKKYLLILGLIFLLPFCAQEKLRHAPTAKKGVLDLSDWNFHTQGRVSLYGEWEFYYNQFIYPEDFKAHFKHTSTVINNSPADIQGKDWIEVPALWNTKEVNGQKLSNEGFATYRLKLLVPEDDKPYGFRIGDMYSAYTIWVNGIEIGNNGHPAKTIEEEKAEWYPDVSYASLLPGENEIIIHVSNHAHRKGGTWSDLEIGAYEDVANYKNWLIAFDFFLIGSLLIMAIYHFGLYTLRRADKTSFLLGLFCIFTTLRIGVTGERLLVPHLPFRGFETQVKLEYISLFMSTSLFAHFIYELFYQVASKIYVKFTWLLCITLTLFTLITKATIYSHTAVAFQVYIILSAFYILHIMIKAIRAKLDGAIAALIGALVMFSTVIMEVLYQNEVSVFTAIPPIYIYPFGVFLFLFFQSFMLSQRFSKAFFSVERLSNYLMKTNEAYSKFVPTEFLVLLNKESIMDIRLGDQVQQEMTVMFSDIRRFTNLSEKMSPSDNFNFINSYLKRMNPYIQDHNGFIDKYIGDAIMALFPDSPEDALKSAIDMEKEIASYNIHRKEEGYEPIAVGFGIHIGKLMLGIVGADNRMDGTVISDSVNLAARLESLTKEYKISIMISEDVLIRIKKRQKYHYRLLDRVLVKGKSEKVVVYHVYDGESEEYIAAIDKIKDSFEDAVDAFHGKDYNKALNLFQQVLEEKPDDHPTEIYVDRCKQMLSLSTTGSIKAV